MVYVWDFNQIFNTFMAKVNFQMSGIQHKEWFIPAMLHHICTTLMQQKIVSQSEALDLTMNLEASPVRETGAIWMQVHS